MEYMIQRVLLILVAVVGVLVLLSIILGLIKAKQVKIEGTKTYVLDTLAKLAKSCFERNTPRRASIICFELEFKSDGSISSSEIVERTGREGIPSVADNIGDSGKIVIRYENQNIYIEKVKYERISS